MIAAVNNAKRLDWPGWSLGLMRSFVSGGAGAITATLTVGFTDAKDWGPNQIGHMFMLFSATFLGTGLFHMMSFLQTHPTPDVIVVAEVETTTKVTPADHAIAPTETTSTTQVLGPVPPVDKKENQ